VQLIERFYDPTSYLADAEGDDLAEVVVDDGKLKNENGMVLIDDEDIRRQDIRWLRSNMGYVGQVRLILSTSRRASTYLLVSLTMLYFSRSLFCLTILSTTTLQWAKQDARRKR
jgi:hypothetical protein